MTNTLEGVRVFHETYGLPVTDAPDLSDTRTNTLRINLLQEELDELKEALETNDVVGVLDALTDLQYVLDGTYLSLGYHLVKDAAFDEVQRSNMSKLGLDGKPIIRPEDGKILKGPNFSEPDLAAVLQNFEQSKAA